MKYLAACFLVALMCSSCAIGSLASAVSLNSRSADSLTTEGEEALYKRMKDRMYTEGQYSHANGYQISGHPGS